MTPSFLDTIGREFRWAICEVVNTERSRTGDAAEIWRKAFGEEPTPENFKLTSPPDSQFEFSTLPAKDLERFRLACVEHYGRTAITTRHMRNTIWQTARSSGTIRYLKLDGTEYDGSECFPKRKKKRRGQDS